MYLRSRSIVKSPIPSTGLKKPSKTMKTMFQQTEGIPSVVTGQARATTMVSITGQPHPGDWTPSFLQGLAPCCLHLPRPPAFILQATRLPDHRPVGALSRKANSKSQLGEAAGCKRSGKSIITWTKQVLKTLAPLLVALKCSSADAIFFHIFCEWYHPNATWETSESFFLILPHLFLSAQPAISCPKRPI